MTEAEIGVMHFEGSEMGHEQQNAALEPRKGKGMDSPLASPQGEWICPQG